MYQNNTLNTRATLKTVSPFIVEVERTDDDFLFACLRFNDRFVMRFSYNFDEDAHRPLTLDEIDISHAPILNNLHALAIASSIVALNFTVDTETPADLPLVMRATQDLTESA